MIHSFGNDETEMVYKGIWAKHIPPEIQRIGRRKLRVINSATDYTDLIKPPNNKFEKLKGDLKGKCSIRINNQWRIIFRWENGNAFDVEIIDYHR